MRKTISKIVFLIFLILLVNCQEPSITIEPEALSPSVIDDAFFAECTGDFANQIVSIETEDKQYIQHQFTAIHVSSSYQKTEL